jgi:hypothetical protein
MDASLTLELLTLGTTSMSEFGAFKPVSVSVLSFDNSFKTGYSLVLQKQIDSFKSVSFFSYI